MPRICYLDFETFWSTEHSLSKMHPIDYVLHPETEIQSVSIAWDDWPIDVLFGEDNISKAFAKHDWSDAIVVAHNNAGFDALIAAWRFGIKPKAWACTLAMVQPFLGITAGGSLKAVAEHLKLPPKGSLEDVNTKGKKLKDFTPEEIAKMKVYNKHDTFLCREIFKHYAPMLGVKELKLIDMAIRMTVEPELEADTALLGSALATEIQRKNDALIKLARLTGNYQDGMSIDDAITTMKSVVMSQPQFAALLNNLGAEVPMKESASAKNPDGTPKMIPALAKTDQGMTDLQEYEDPDGDEDRAQLVRIAACTRLEVKSTQLETRLRTYLRVSNMLGGKLPMPVNYCGAGITWRFSGGLKMNVQNNPRIDPKYPKPSDALRQSIIAPEGKCIVVVDSSNIELRVAHMLAGQMDTVEKLRNKEDLYCWFASGIYGRTITKADDMERYLGKQAMLQLQFNASWRSFQKTARINSKGKVMLPDDEAKRIVDVWRDSFPCISGGRKGRDENGMWQKCEKAITAMVAGDHLVVDQWGLCHTTQGYVITPNGHWLQYADLRKHMNARGKDEWRYGRGRHTGSLFGGKLFANIVQHLARLIVMEQTLEIAKRYSVKLTCHDEAVMLVDDELGEECEAYALQCFSKAPAWWPDIPLAAEAGIGYSYSEAK